MNDSMEFHIHVVKYITLQKAEKRHHPHPPHPPPPQNKILVLHSF